MDDKMIDVGGLALHVRTEGSGPPLLFTAPGWGPSVDFYIATLQPLRDRFTVAWVDPRRTGRSGSPADGDYDLDALVGDFDAVRRALGWDRMWIAGHSMGGHLALRYLAAYPESCNGVVGLCTYGDTDEQFWTERETRLQARSAEPWFPVADEAFARFQAASARDITDAELQELLMDALPAYFVDQSKLKEAADDFSTVTFSGGAAPYFLRNAEMAVLTALHGLPTPAVIIAADGDFICSPPLNRRIHEALPNSTLIEISEAGHFPWLEQPEQFWPPLHRALDAYLVPA